MKSEKSFMEDISIKELMATQNLRDPDTGVFVGNMQCSHLRNDPIVQDWLALYPPGTQNLYRSTFNIFLNVSGVTTEDLVAMETPKLKAPTKSVMGSLLNGGRVSAAKRVMNVMKSFGNHYDKYMRFAYNEKVRVGRIKNQIPPKPDQVYKIAAAAAARSQPASPRNKAMVLFDWVTALRSNAICFARCGAVMGYSENDCPIPLKVGNKFQKVGGDLWVTDTKLSGYGVDYYYTFIAKEGFLPTMEWLKWREQHLGSYKESDYLFCVTTGGGLGAHTERIGGKISPRANWEWFKEALPYAGIAKESMTFHKLRASFKSVIIGAGVDEEVREVMMGHAPEGSAKNYFDFNDVEMARKKYKMADWTMTGTARLDKLEQDYATAMQRIKELEHQQSKFPMKEFFEFMKIRQVPSTGKR